MMQGFISGFIFGILILVTVCISFYPKILDKKSDYESFCRLNNKKLHYEMEIVDSKFEYYFECK